MHDPKFEKDVQQKMEELVFTPPASVWLNVEKEVNKEKKRRFLPFWLFFLPASLLVGAGVIYFTTRPVAHMVHPKGSGDPGSRPELSPVKVQQNPDSSLVFNRSTSKTSDMAGQPVYDHPQRETAGLPRHHATGPTVGGQQPATGDSPAKRNSHARVEPARPEENSKIVEPSRPEEEKTIAKSARPQENSKIAQPSRNEEENRIAKSARSQENSKKAQPSRPEENSRTAQSAKPEENNTIEPDPETLAAGKTGPAAHPFVHRSVFPQRSAIDRHAGIITASSLSAISKGPAAAKTRLPEPRRPWEAGFAGGIGLSSLNQGLLDKSSVTSAAYANYFSAITGVPQTYVSNAQPDLSFWAGVLLQKSLRKDLSMTLGLNLHYYSSRIKTGKKVNSDLAGLQSPSANPNNSFILGNGGLAASGRAYPYYSPGNNESFTNRYYFLELPGSISWQVGHSKTMPLFWEGGFSLSYLVSSNSLYYNPKSGVFFKDGSVINRTQASIFTGLMVGLPLHGLRIQAGPQIQYGFTNLLNNQGAGGQHLLYGGIKFVFLPGKWKK